MKERKREKNDSVKERAPARSERGNCVDETEKGNNAMIKVRKKNCQTKQKNKSW